MGCSVHLSSISLLLITCTAVLGQNTEAELPCTHARVDCLTRVSEVNKTIQLEISCVCKKRQDVVEFLEYLYPVKCPHIPIKPSDKLIDHSILRIKNCDIEKKEFPQEFLKLLRRSKKFSVFVDDSQTLRIPVPSSYENDHKEPEITTVIKNSGVTGIGRGWFNMAKSLSLQIINSSLGILEAGVFGNYDKDTLVDIQLINTVVQVIKADAFSLPINGKLEIKGGNIAQIERYAIQGGKSVTFEASVISNIQSEAFNIYGMQEFNLDSCIIAKVDKMVIFQDSKRNRVDAPKMPEVEQVYIKGNKFSSLDGDAFVGLCEEKNIMFENNFINILTSPFRLESEHCPTLRKWKESVKNNGFRCQMNDSTCQKFGDNIYMNCLLHGTSWCLCENEDDNATGKNVTLGEKEDGGPCRVSWIETMMKYCTDIDEGSFAECKSIINADDCKRGRSLFLSSSSNVPELSFIIIFASVATMFTFIKGHYSYLSHISSNYLK